MSVVAWYVRFVIRRWRLVLLGLLLLSVGAVLVLGRARLGTSLGKLFLGETPAYQEYLALAREFASDEVVVVAIEDVAILTTENLDRLARVHDALRDLPDVARITSVHTAQHVRVRSGTLRARTYAEIARDRQDDLPGVLRLIQEDEIAGGLLVSKDGRHAAVVVELYPDADRPAEQIPSIVDRITSAMVGAGFPAKKLRLTGFLSVFAELMRQSEVNITRLFPLVGVVLLIVVWLLFRRLWPVAVTLGVSVLGVLWTVAFAVVLDPTISILMSIVPPVILIVGFSDVIHLCSAYLIELRAGLEKEEAVVAACTDVGVACIWTSATTFVGFVAMSFVPTPAFRMLGLVLGFGVAVALLIAVTLVPILFHLMPRPKPWRRGATSAVQDGLDHVLGWARGVSIQRPWWVIGAFAVVSVGVGVGLARFEIETAFTERLSESNPVSRDLRFFREHFGRTNQLDIFLSTPEKEGLFDADLMRRWAALEGEIEARADVEQVLSFVDLIRRVHRDFGGEGDLPRTRPGIAQYTLLLEMSGADALAQLVDFDRRRARIAVRLLEEKVRAAYDAGQAIATRATALLGDRVEVAPNGILYLLGGWLDEIVAGQRRGLLFTLVVVAIMMCFAVRSVRVGLWSMVPNAFPVLFLGGWLGLTTEAVDSDAMTLGMLAIGIGVDDTIHFLVRFRLESGRCADRATALDRTFGFAGRAIVMTTVTLALGFAPLALSEYATIQYFGTLLPLTLVVALLADLLLVPALARVGAMAFPPREAAARS